MQIEGYTKLYGIIMNSGTLIETGWTPSVFPFHIEMGIIPLSYSQHVPFGYRQIKNGRWVGLGLQRYNNYLFYIYLTGYAGYRFSYIEGNEYLCIIDETITSAYAQVNGNYLYNGSSFGGNIIFGNIPFNVHGGVNVITRLTIEESGVLLRDFIPIREGSTGLFGLYDNVTGMFLGNSGTGIIEGYYV